ncbi:unnamed protein product [Chrysoparadoxa australica]
MLGVDYGSDSESDGSSSGSEGSEREEKEEQPASGLPSVDDIFASTAGVCDTLEPEEKEVKPKPWEEKAKAKEKRMRSEEALGKEQPVPVAAAASKKLKKGAKGTAQPPRTEHGKKPTKESAKERVKGQRMKGQAGIGSDFRTWKTDEEMRMRQQFD